MNVNISEHIYLNSNPSITPNHLVEVFARDISDDFGFSLNFLKTKTPFYMGFGYHHPMFYDFE